MYRCPEQDCGITLPIGGKCPCSYIKNRDVFLIEIEEESMANTIKYEGNLSRFAGQKKGKLVHVEPMPIKEVSHELLELIGMEKPVNNKMVACCTFVGEKGIPFTEIRKHGSSLITKLKAEIGHEFIIDRPETGYKVEQLNFEGGEE